MNKSIGTTLFILLSFSCLSIHSVTGYNLCNVINNDDNYNKMSCLVICSKLRNFLWGCFYRSILGIDIFYLQSDGLVKVCSENLDVS